MCPREALNGVSNSPPVFYLYCQLCLEWVHFDDDADDKDLLIQDITRGVGTFTISWLLNEASTN